MFHALRLSLNKVKINLNVYSCLEFMNQIVFAYQKNKNEDEDVGEDVGGERKEGNYVVVWFFLQEKKKVFVLCVGWFFVKQIFILAQNLDAF